MRLLTNAFLCNSSRHTSTLPKSAASKLKSFDGKHVRVAGFVEQGPTATRGLAGVLERDLGAMLRRILEEAYPEGLRPARASS